MRPKQLPSSEDGGRPPVEEHRPQAERPSAVLPSVFEVASVGLCRLDAGGVLQAANPALAAMLGDRAPEDLSGRSLRARFADPSQADRVFGMLANDGEVGSFETELLRRNGSLVRVRIAARPALDLPGSFDVIVEDVSELRQARQALREAEDKLLKIFQTSLDAITVNTLAEGTYLEVNDEFVRLTGYPREHVIGRSAADIGIWRDPEQLRFVVREVVASGIVRNLEGEFITKDGTVVSALFSAERVTIGSEPCILSIVRDVRERREAERAIHESQQRYRAIFEESKDIIFVSDTNGMLVDVNPAAVALLKCDSKEELLATGNATAFYENPGVHAELVRRLEREGQLDNVEIDLRAKDGTRLKTILHGTPLHDASGGLIGVVGSLRDITEHTRLQEQLLRSQRMEAIGRLAGGVAHDFNNLLTVIRAAAGLALIQVSEDDPIRPRLDEIDDAAQRSAELTNQLLAFARRRVVSPKVLDVNELVTNLETMLRRVIGENIDLLTRHGADLWNVRADRGQIEQVLVNLVVNARDAMPGGGAVVIETSNVTLDAKDTATLGIEPGSYVCLAVTDTGCGMDDGVLARLFEPFFTTKEPGKGTGLGLATCYGIVTQSRGAFAVKSAPGRGSTFRVYLPRVEASPPVATTARRRERPRGHETLLIVEDAPMVRRLTARMLRECGYTVLEAETGEEAIALLGTPEGSRVELLVSDVVLPVMSGPEVADRIRHLRPGIRVLFISGYADDATLDSRIREGSVAFLQKPFTQDVLAEEVRHVLDVDAGARAR